MALKSFRWLLQYQLFIPIFSVSLLSEGAGCLGTQHGCRPAEHAVCYTSSGDVEIVGRPCAVCNGLNANDIAAGKHTTQFSALQEASLRSLSHATSHHYLLDDKGVAFGCIDLAEASPWAAYLSHHRARRCEGCYVPHGVSFIVAATMGHAISLFGKYD